MGQFASSKTFDSQDQYRLIHDIYVLLDDGDRRVVEDYGLTTSQYALLMQLENGRGQRLTTLSHSLLRAKSTITRIVDQLEAGGWIHRIADPDDRRAQRISLTEEGARRRDEVSASHQKSLTARLSILTDEELAELNSTLLKLRDGLRENLDQVRE